MADLQDAGFWARFMSRLTGRHHLDKGSSMPPFRGESTPSGTAVTAETALKLSAGWACVRLKLFQHCLYIFEMEMEILLQTIRYMPFCTIVRTRI